MSLLSMFFAATPENPRFNLNDPVAWDALGAEPASSGQRVNRDIALTYSPWWRGVNLIANDVAKLHQYVWRRIGGRKEKAVDHPAYYLLRRKPNPYQTASDFRRQLTGHVVAQGNGYAYIVRRGDGGASELWPLLPDCTWPVRANGVLYYVTQVGGEQRKLPAADVLHIQGLGYDGLQGYSVVDKAREALGVGLARAKWQATFYRNGARAGVLLESPNTIPDLAKRGLREDWDRMHAGLNNAHRTAILDRGLKANKITFGPEDAQLIESQEFSIVEIANFIGVPPHKLGDKSSRGYGSIEAENLSYLAESLDPRLVCWEDEAWDKLLTEEEKSQETHEVLFDRRAITRADMTARANYNRVALGGAPWQTINEVRDEDGFDPIEGGDELPRPLNMTFGQPNPEEPADPEDQADPPAKPPAPPTKPSKNKKDQKDEEAAADTDTGFVATAQNALRAALAETLAEAVGRMVRRVGAEVKRAARDGRQFQAWLDGLETAHGGLIREVLAPLERACRACRGGDWIVSYGRGEGRISITDKGVRPIPETRLADWLLAALQHEFLELTGRCTAGQLQQAAIDLADALARRLPAAAAEAYLP